MANWKSQQNIQILGDKPIDKGGSFLDYTSAKLDHFTRDMTLPILPLSEEEGSLNRWAEFTLANQDQSSAFARGAAHVVEAYSETLIPAEFAFNLYDKVFGEQELIEDRVLQPEEANELYKMPSGQEFREPVYERAAKIKYNNYIKDILVKDAVDNAYNGDNKGWKATAGVLMGLGVTSLNDAPNVSTMFLPVFRGLQLGKFVNLSQKRWQLVEGLVDAGVTGAPIEYTNWALVQQSGGMLTAQDSFTNWAFGTGAGGVLSPLSSGVKQAFSLNPKAQELQNSISNDLQANKKWIELNEEGKQLLARKAELESQEAELNNYNFKEGSENEAITTMQNDINDFEESNPNFVEREEIEVDAEQPQVESPEVEAQRKALQEEIAGVDELILDNANARAKVYKDTFVDYFPKWKDVSVNEDINILRNFDDIEDAALKGRISQAYENAEEGMIRIAHFDRDTNQVYVFTDRAYQSDYNDATIQSFIESSIFEESVIHYGFKNLLSDADIQRIQTDIKSKHQDLLDQKISDNPDISEEAAIEEVFADLMNADLYSPDSVLNIATTYVKELEVKFSERGSSLKGRDIQTSMRYILREMRKNGKWGVKPKVDSISREDRDAEIDKIAAERKAERGQVERAETVKAEIQRYDAEIDKLNEEIKQSKARRRQQLSQAKKKAEASRQKLAKEEREASKSLKSLLNREVEYEGESYSLTQERSGTVTLVGDKRDIEIPIDDDIANVKAIDMGFTPIDTD